MLITERAKRRCVPWPRPPAARAKPFHRVVLSDGERFLGYQAGIAVFVDALWVMVFASYLLAARRAPTGDRTVARRSQQCDAMRR
jgi:hypothetical protein